MEPFAADATMSATKRPRARPGAGYQRIGRLKPVLSWFIKWP